MAIKYKQIQHTVLELTFLLQSLQFSNLLGKIFRKINMHLEVNTLQQNRRIELVGLIIFNAKETDLTA